MVPASTTLRLAGAATGLERVQISALARALYDNGGFPAYAVNQIAIYSAPNLPQASTEDEAWNDRAEAIWADWSRRADFLGRPEFTLDAIQTIASQAIDLDGDVGLALTTASGFPQVQLIEGWRIGSGFGSDEAERKAIDGVRVDDSGRVVSYLVSGNDSKPVEVSANEMILVRDPSVTSPYRGLSPLRRGMNDIRDMRDILGFEKLAVKTNSGLIGVLEGQALDEDEAAAFNLGTGQPLASIPRPEPQTSESEIPDDESAGEQALTRADLLGGDIPIIPDGKKLTRIESNRPNAQFGDFLDSLVAQFVSGLDVPPAFFLDVKLTGPNQRAVLAKAQRKFSQRQDAICRAVEWLWVRVIGWAIETKQLPAVDGWWRVNFQRPARITIDAGREAQQDREDQSRSLLTRQDHFGGRGKDWQRETNQALKEDRFIIGKVKELAADTGLPVQLILARYGFGNPNATQPPDQQQQSGDQSGGNATT